MWNYDGGGVGGEGEGGWLYDLLTGFKTRDNWSICLDERKRIGGLFQNKIKYI